MSSFLSQISGRSVLFITTKNLDYIRNSQEIALLQKHAASLSIIGSKSSSYPKRLLYVWSRLLFTSVKPFSVIMIGFAPQLVVPLFFWKFRRKFLIEDFFISFYDTLVYDRQKFSEKSIPGRLLHLLDQLTIGCGDLILSDTKAHGAYFAEEFCFPQEQILPLYLKADTSIYYPRPRLSKDKRFHVLYFGSILPLQGLPVILGAVERLKENPCLCFTLIGPIPEQVKKPQGANIHYISWLPQEKLAEKIADADLCLAGHFHPTIQKARRTIPGKAYIYEAMKKPMILGDNPATRELEKKWSVPVYYVPMGDEKVLADCILSAAESFSFCKQQP